MTFGKLCLLLFACQHLSIVTAADPMERSPNCSDPVVRTDNNGVIQSHRAFGRELYPNNFFCDWIIQAPANHRIMTQFTFINIEEERRCNYDYVILEDYQHSYSRFCASIDIYRNLTRSNTLLVSFHSDKATRYEGFLLRYWFVNPKTDNFSLNKYEKVCHAKEYQCVDDNSCIQKAWVCDGIRDCRDNSDEINCEFKRSCHPSLITCPKGDCVAYDRWCNEGSIKCADTPGQTVCEGHTNRSMAIPATEFDPHHCSVQPIKPKNLNITMDNPQIVGGEEVVPGSWPWMASLRYGSSHYCGATLISRSWAVTAAHCFENYRSGSGWALDLGRHHVNNDGHTQRIDVNDIITHPNYNAGTIENDIALLKLSTEAILSTRIQTLCLSDPMIEPKAKQRCVILGWGVTRNTGSEGVLKQAILPIVERSNCKAVYTDFSDGMLCAGYEEGGVDACQLDSGGPLICSSNGSLVLSGITSWGEGCALPGKPGVYTNVARYITWIKSWVKDLYPRGG